MERYIIAVDQSTSASKAFLVDDQGAIVRRYSKPHAQYTPAPGHVEHDGEEIYRNVAEAIQAVGEGLGAGQVRALALANQRETTVLWDRRTGAPLHRAIVWQDVRAQSLCDAMADRADAIRARTGIPLSPYYSAAKAAAVLGENPALRTDALCVGTIDAYLIYRLTGGRVFATDQSNASRTQLMDLNALAWDPEICGWFGIPVEALPEIRYADEGFGTLALAGPLAGVPITGVLGDSHAALFGHGCLAPGMAKATYGTGSSVMMNIGAAPAQSRHGLSCSVGFGFRGQVHYVLEGNVTCSGDTLCWLRDELGLIRDIDEVEAAARQMEDAQGVYLVPAFSGLGAPYFDGSARALLWGMSRGTERAHILRAAMESIAYQDADIVRAMALDTGQPLTRLNADGGATRNATLMQFQADILGCPVACAADSELSALGVAYLVGMAQGVWDGLDAIPARARGPIHYTPRMTEKDRNQRLDGWRDAVGRAHGR